MTVSWRLIWLIWIFSKSWQRNLTAEQFPLNIEPLCFQRVDISVVLFNSFVHLFHIFEVIELIQYEIEVGIHVG